MSKNFLEIGNRLRLLRKKHGIKSHVLLSSQIKISRNRIQRIETGKTEPTASEIKAYVERFGVSERWILTGEEDAISSMVREGRPEWSLNTLEEIFRRIEALEERRGLKTKQAKKGDPPNVKSCQYKENGDKKD